MVPGRDAQIELRTEDSGDGAVLKVSDNGLGIAAEDLPSIFRPFFTTKGAGTGLGLPLARSIIEQHGGHIEVESKRGRGTTFKITLPRK
jgi:signal transduction histidine kinase